MTNSTKTIETTEVAIENVYPTTAEQVYPEYADLTETELAKLMDEVYK